MKQPVTITLTPKDVGITFRCVDRDKLEAHHFINKWADIIIHPHVIFKDDDGFTKTIKNDNKQRFIHKI